MYHDVTTFAPYYQEMMFTAQVTQSHSGRSSSGLHYVLSSLTSNDLKLLLLLSRETHGMKEGLPFSTLYELCLSEMVVSSEKSLQLILKELEDHALIKQLNSGNSPQENYLYIVLPRELKSFCDSYPVSFTWFEKQFTVHQSYKSFQIHHSMMIHSLTNKLPSYPSAVS